MNILLNLLAVIGAMGFFVGIGTILSKAATSVDPSDNGW
jgi:hypothetical protein